MSLADIIQIIIGILSLIATIAVSFLIYWLQSQHEKEMERMVEAQKEKEMQEKAKLFLMENEEERDYLPLCVIAANLCRLQRHTRKIYTNYCRCSFELQQEILKQAGFSITPMQGEKWVYECIEKLKADIEAYCLGEDYLYDGAKYFFRGYERYRELEWKGTPAIFLPICKDNRIRQMTNRKTIDIDSYIEEYIYYYFERHMQFEEDIPQPPLDYMWISQDLANAEESVVCMWIMEVVEAISTNLRYKNRDMNEEQLLDFTDAVPETYEDKYYMALQSLYNTYCIR